MNDQAQMNEELRALEEEERRALDHYNALIDEINDSDRLWGYAPRMATRKTKPTVYAADVEVGDRVRIGYRPVEREPKIGWATVRACAKVRSRVFAFSSGPKIALLLEGPDSLFRQKELAPSARVERATSEPHRPREPA
jgi:hypothetical protein